MHVITTRMHSLSEAPTVRKLIKTQLQLRHSAHNDERGMLGVAHITSCPNAFISTHSS